MTDARLPGDGGREVSSTGPLRLDLHVATGRSTRFYVPVARRQSTGRAQKCATEKSRA